MRHLAPGYEKAGEVFDAILAEDPAFSAQVAAYVGDQKVVDLTGGPDLAADALLPVYSSSKGCTGIAIALLVQRGQLDLDAAVASYWPEFAAAGKQSITVRQLLSHQAGLPTVDGGYTVDEIIEHSALAAKLAAQTPYWRPGAGHGYHPVTFGTLADELVRRVDGRTLPVFFTEEVAAPRGLDVHLGVPEALDVRVAASDLPTQADLTAWMEKLADAAPDPDGFGSLLEPGGGPALYAMVNDERFRRVGQPAAGGLATARGLAALYASLRFDLGAPPLLTDETLAAFAQIQVAGKDFVAGRENRFGVCFELPSELIRFGSPRAFGHGGMGGSVAFCDPTYDFSFGYLPKRMPGPNGADRVMTLVRAIRSCA